MILGGGAISYERGTPVVMMTAGGPSVHCWGGGCFKLTFFMGELTLKGLGPGSASEQGFVLRCPVQLSKSPLLMVLTNLKETNLKGFKDFHLKDKAGIWP